MPMRFLYPTIPSGRRSRERLESVRASPRKQPLLRWLQRAEELRLLPLQCLRRYGSFLWNSDIVGRRRRMGWLTRGSGWRGGLRRQAYLFDAMSDDTRLLEASRPGYITAWEAFYGSTTDGQSPPLPGFSNNPVGLLNLGNMISYSAEDMRESLRTSIAASYEPMSRSAAKRAQID